MMVMRVMRMLAMRRRVRKTGWRGRRVGKMTKK